MVCFSLVLYKTKGMEYTEFEKRICSLATDHKKYTRQLPRVQKENRVVFIQALCYGFTLEQAFSMMDTGTLTETDILKSLQQKTKDNIAEIQA
jgi:hypothetical protein